MRSFQEMIALFVGGSYFWDWLLITIVLAVFVPWCVHMLRARARPSVFSGPVALLLLAVVFVVLNGRAVPTGDEPHYLIMAQSLLSDGDLDLRNNYENMDYLAYYPDVIPDPHVVAVGEHWYPVHGIGLPLLAAPFYAVAGRPGVTALLVLIIASGLGALWSLLRRAGFRPQVASIATLVAGFTLPLASMSGQVFPEVPAFLLVALALRAIGMPVLAGWGFLGFVVSLVLLPWLHIKYAALAAALLLAAALTHRRRGAAPPLALATGSLIASIAGLAFVSYQLYGSLLPGVPGVCCQPSVGEDWFAPIMAQFFAAPWVGLTGLLFDQQSGLFFASPVYILAIPGIVLLWHRKRILGVACGMVFASVYLPAGAFVVWDGGFASPARLLTPVVPVLALGIAAMLDAAERRGWQLFCALAILSFFHAYLMTSLPSFTRYGDPVTQHNFFISLLERTTRLDLTVLFPSFRNPEPITWLTTGGYVLVIVVISALLVRQPIAPPRYQSGTRDHLPFESGIDV